MKYLNYAVYSKSVAIEYRKVDTLDLTAFIEVLRQSGLAERRPVDDRDRVARMLHNSNLIIIAVHTETQAVVGVARSITDYSYCCYLSDLAVDKAYQGRGIGKQLIQETRAATGPECICLLLSAPDALPFYKHIGMSQAGNAFLYGRER